MSAPRHLPIVAALIAVAGCGEAELPLQKVADGEAEITGQGVLVIVVDGLRWDHTVLADYDRDTTPFLAEFAADAVTFTNAWSASPGLVASHVAILSGCDPTLAQPPDIGPATPTASDDEEAWFVPDDLWLLGRPFLGQGWRTAAFVDHPDIAELRGFNRGFREFVEYGGDPDSETRGAGAFGVGKRFIDWLRTLPLDQDWFAYIHMNDLERAWYGGRRKVVVRGATEGTDEWRRRPELVYVPPLGLTEPLFHALPPSRAARAGAASLAEYELRYDRGIRAVDASLGRLVATARDYGRDDDMTIVIVGSFGTELGEHGLYLQAGLAEEEDLHVPLLVSPSRAVRERLGWDAGPPRTRSGALVGLVDVAPTLVDLAGVGELPVAHGTSLRPLLDGSAESVRARVMTRSSVLPGFAVVEGTSIRSVYDHSRAPAALRGSWSGEAGESDGVQGEASLQPLWEHWEHLLEGERRALHFGIGSSDRGRATEIRALQGVIARDHGVPQEETNRTDPDGFQGGGGR